MLWSIKYIFLLSQHSHKQAMSMVPRQASTPEWEGCPLPLVPFCPLLTAICVSRSVLSDSLVPMDCSPPGSSVHGILQARKLGCHFLLQGIFPTQGLNLHWTVWVSFIVGRLFSGWATREVWLWSSDVLTLLWNPLMPFACILYPDLQ